MITTKGKNYNYEKILYDPSNNLIITSSEMDNPKFSYPSSFIVGAVYRPRSGIFSTISVNYIRTFWSKFDNDLEPTYFYDTNDFNVGVEHLFDTGAIFRFGIFYHENYEIEHLAEAGITIGTGYNISKKYFIDCGIEYSPLTYEMTDLFPDGDYNGLEPLTDAVNRTSPDKIEQVKLRAIVSFGINLK